MRSGDVNRSCGRHRSTSRRILTVRGAVASLVLHHWVQKRPSSKLRMDRVAHVLFGLSGVEEHNFETLGEQVVDFPWSLVVAVVRYE